MNAATKLMNFIKASILHTLLNVLFVFQVAMDLADTFQIVHYALAIVELHEEGLVAV